MYQQHCFWGGGGFKLFFVCLFVFVVLIDVFVLLFVLFLLLFFFWGGGEGWKGVVFSLLCTQWAAKGSCLFFFNTDC